MTKGNEDQRYDPKIRQFYTAKLNKEADSMEKALVHVTALRALPYINDDVFSLVFRLQRVVSTELIAELRARAQNETYIGNCAAFHEGDLPCVTE